MKAALPMLLPRLVDGVPFLDNPLWTVGGSSECRSSGLDLYGSSSFDEELDEVKHREEKDSTHWGIEQSLSRCYVATSSWAYADVRDLGVPRYYVPSLSPTKTSLMPACSDPNTVCGEAADTYAFRSDDKGIKHPRILGEEKIRRKKSPCSVELGKPWGRIRCDNHNKARQTRPFETCVCCFYARCCLWPNGKISGTITAACKCAVCEAYEALDENLGPFFIATAQRPGRARRAIIAACKTRKASLTIQTYFQPITTE